MSVAAKFYVSKLERNAYNPAALTITMQPVTRGEENKAWAVATPSGSITLTIANPAAAEVFGERLGQEFDILFTPIDPEPVE